MLYAKKLMKDFGIYGLLARGMFTVLLIPLLTGCETLAQKHARERMQKREDMLLVQEDTRQLSGQMETLEFEIERLTRELDAVRRETLETTRMEMKSLETRVANVEQSTTDLERARQKDRKEIVETLSRKIADIVSKSAPARRSGRSSEYGYEHVVQPGETLSEIAAAYSVTVNVIMEENRIQNANRVRVGQKLFIPE